MNLHTLSGKDFDVYVGDHLVHVNTGNVKITDERKVRMRRGVPDGFVDGEARAEGELMLCHEDWLLIQAEAAKAGSWKGIDPIDISFIAETNAGEKRVEAFGCILKLDEIVSIDSKGGEADMTKIMFEVADKRFVRINGVPYLRPDEIENLS